MTPDPESYFPGPEIFENGGVQGPGQTNDFSNDNQNFFGSVRPNVYDRFDVTQAPPSIRTVRPPGARPPSYQNPGPTYGYDTDKVDNGEDYRPPPRPNGPDYSTATILHHGDSTKGSAPFRVGLDLYPMTGDTALGKQSSSSSSGGGIYDLSPFVSGEDNKHEVLLHLNLFSRKPTHLGGSRAQDIDLLSRYKNNVIFQKIFHSLQLIYPLSTVSSTVVFSFLC